MSDPRLDVEALLLRAALLAGYGAQARPLAQRLAAATVAGDARSCFEGGTPLQLSIDAPGPAGLRVGLRLPDNDPAPALEGLVPAAAVEFYARMLYDRLLASCNCTCHSEVARGPSRNVCSSCTF